jgi:hypothetical protein
MVDHAEPLSLLLWAVVAFAASFYPLGLMLGAPCSPCCNPDCDDVFDFNRCIRFVNNDQAAPPTDVALGASMIGPVHGFSFKVNRPGDVGARRVATRIIVPFKVFLFGAGASSMSDGETRTAIYAYQYSQGTDRQDAVRWTITLQGVTMPLNPPQFQSMSVTTTGNTTGTITYPVQLPYVNKSSTPAVRVHGCSVVSGAEWLDGAVVTENDLNAMLSSSIVTDPNRVTVRSVFTLNAAIFQYVPRGSSVILSYVVEHARGNTRRYGTQQIRVSQTADAQAIPEAGLAPLAITAAPYVDTPFTRTPPVFAGDTPTTKTAIIYTDNLFTSEATTADIEVDFPAVELRPTGSQLHSGLTLDYVQENEFVLLRNPLPDAELLDERWIMAPVFQAAPYEVSEFGEGAILALNNSWIYDHDLVESFLNGEASLPYQTIGHGTFTIQVSPQAKYCGDPLFKRVFISSNAGGYRPYVTATDVIERVVTCKLSTPPASLEWEGDPADMTLKLGYTNSTYNYLGYQYQCTSPRFVNRSLERGIRLRSFYCGDLLWALENGPCRTSVRTPFAGGWGPDEFTLGGDYTLPSQFGTRCQGFTILPINQGTTREFNVPKEGGVVSVDRPAGDGFPAFTINLQIPAHYGKYSTLYHLPFELSAYITQAGFENECPFNVRWLANTRNVGAYDSSEAAFVSERCPIMGQVEHVTDDVFNRVVQQPGCDWSVTSSASWLIAERVEEGLEEGLLRLSIDDSVEAVFTELNNTRRSAVITIISGGTTKTWTIRHRRL